MKQRIVPISLTKIQFLKIYCLYGPAGKKCWSSFFPVDLLSDEWKFLFHALHSIASKKTLTWDNTSNCPRKTFLLLCNNSVKRNFESSRRIWRFLSLLFDRGFSLLCFLYPRNFDVFQEAKAMDWKAYDKTFLLLRLLWVKFIILQGRRKRKALLSHNWTSPICEEKKSNLKKKGASPGEV